MSVWQSIAKAFHLGQGAKQAERSATAILRASSPLFSLPFDRTHAAREYYGWVHALASINANQLARNPLKLYRTGKRGGVRLVTPKDRKRMLRSKSLSRKAAQAIDGRSDIYEVMDQHVALDLLHDPNSEMSGGEFAVSRFLHLELVGDQFIALHRGDDGVPQALSLLNPLFCVPVFGKQEDDRLIVQWKYGTTGRKLELDAADVVHIRRPHPFHAWRGLGKIEAGWSTVKTNSAMHLADLAFYTAGMRPDYAVTVKGSGGSQEQLNRAMADLTAQLSQPDDGGRFVGFTGDVTLTPLGWPPKDLGPRTVVLEELSAVFGVPRDKAIGGATYANAEQADANWLRDTIAPTLRIDEDALNETYLPNFPDIADAGLFVYDNPEHDSSEGDTAASTRATSLYQSQLVTRNEARAMVGLEAEPDGDVYASTPAAAPFGSPIGFGQGGGFSLQTTPAGFALQTAASKAGKISALRKRTPRTCAQRLADAYAKYQLAALRKLTPKTKSRTKQTGPTRTKADGFGGPEQTLYRALLDIMRSEVVSATGQAAQVEATRLGLSFDALLPQVLTFADAYTPRLARSLVETRARELQDAVAAGIEAGMSTGEVRDMIQESDAFSPDGIANRAEMIARTEQARAFTAGQIEAWKASGVVTGKRWELSPAACDICRGAARHLEGRTFGLDEPFFVKGSTVRPVNEWGRLEPQHAVQLDYEDVHGPPLHPHCRCSIGPVMEGRS